jgi:hypothetical protein
MYDHPEEWAARGWLPADIENDVFPRLLHEHDCRTVLVPGAGTGRQYVYLRGFDLVGFDVSRRLAREARHRYPAIPTHHRDIVGCERLGTFDGVAVSFVLAHVPDVQAAVRSLRLAARKLIVLREYTWIRDYHEHQTAHDYVALFSDWDLCHREVTDERPNCRAEILAFRP